MTDTRTEVAIVPAIEKPKRRTVRMTLGNTRILKGSIIREKIFGGGRLYLKVKKKDRLNQRPAEFCGLSTFTVADWFSY
jgi:hypothetical protein